MPTISLKEVKSIKFWFALIAEFLGTFLLIIIACGTCAKEDDIVEISLAFGFSVATIVWAITPLSGGHINPAVTVGFLATRKISIFRYVITGPTNCRL